MKGCVVDMRIAKPEKFSSGQPSIKTVHYNAPILIPRLPVITTDKQRDKLIKTIESLVRSSIDYKDLIKYLRTYIDMNQCEFFENFKAGKKKGMIEIHHSPFDLYTIVDVVMQKMEKTEGYLDELVIADKVLQMHYEGLIGLIPLSITAHQLVHDGKLIVPLNCVYGRFVEFTNLFYNELGEERLEILKNNIDMTRHMKKSDFSILNIQYVYTEVDGFKLPQPIEV